MRAIIKEAIDNMHRVIELSNACYDKDDGTLILTDVCGNEWVIEMPLIVANQTMEDLFSTGMTDLRLYNAE